MNVDSLLISEYASADPSGRLTVVNSFNRINGPGPEWLVPVIYLSMVVHAPRDLAGTSHVGEIRLLNSRRQLATAKPAPFDLSFPDDAGQFDDGMPVRCIFTGGFFGLRFKEPGPYAFEVSIDGIFAGAVMLYIRKTDDAPES